jgi:uncharacterized protein YjbI with pentapeptide repeats
MLLQKTWVNLTRDLTSKYVCDELESDQLGKTTGAFPRAVRYAKGINPHFPIDLRHTDMSGLDLRGLNFSYAALAGANFEGSNLTGAKFCSAGLKGVNFKGADLTKANFSGASCQGANFEGATIAGTIYYDETSGVSP